MLWLLVKTKVIILKIVNQFSVFSFCRTSVSPKQPFTEVINFAVCYIIQVKCLIHCVTKLFIFSTGFGLAFNLQPALTIIGTYFQVKRPMANGLAMTGSPVILFTLAPLNQLLFDSFGWRGSFLILGSIVLNCCVAGALMRPVNKNALRKPKTEPPDCNGGAAEEAAAAEASAHSNNLPTNESKNESKSPSCMERFVDFSLFKHRGFLIYLVGNVVMFFGFFAPVVFLAPYAKHQGIDEYSAAFLLSIFALVDMFVRPATGFMGNTKWVRPRIQYFFSFAVSCNGVCHLLCPLASGYTGMVLYAVFFGVAFGMVCSLLFEVLMDLVGAHRFSTAVGLVTIIECAPVLLGPPISGLSVNYDFYFRLPRKNKRNSIKSWELKCAFFSFRSYG